MLVNELLFLPLLHQSTKGIQKQIEKDWENREFIEAICGSIRKITDFLNSFDLSTRGKINMLNERLNLLERKIDYFEARIKSENAE